MRGFAPKFNFIATKDNITVRQINTSANEKNTEIFLTSISIPPDYKDQSRGLASKHFIPCFMINFFHLL